MPSYTRIFDVGPIDLNSAAHAAGDTLFVAQAVAALSRQFRDLGRARLDTIALGVTFGTDPAAVIYVFNDTVTLGAANAAFALAAVDHPKVLGAVTMGAPAAVGAGRVVTQNNLGIILNAADEHNIYIAAATTGTPTPGSSASARVKLGITYLED